MHVPVLICLAAALSAPPAEAQIKRDRAQVRAFRAENPCPATGRTRGACPNFQVDHRFDILGRVVWCWNGRKL